MAAAAQWMLACQPEGTTGLQAAPLAEWPDPVAVQGEYLGISSEGDTLALQVVALGGVEFKAALLPGGFPGAGWDGSDWKEATGTAGDSALNLTGDAFSAEWRAEERAFLLRWGEKQARLSPVQRESPTFGAPPPTGALALFDGSGLEAWTSARLSEDSAMLPESGTAGGALTKAAFGDFTLHAEFRLPLLPEARGQARANSGIYLQNRYELQILDSFGESYSFADTMSAKRVAGAFWEMVAAPVNACYPPGQWQTLDVAFTAARFTEGVKTALAQVTVRLNGITVHADQPLINRTLLGEVESDAPGPFRFQYHGNAVAFRNIWVIPGTGSALSPRLAPARRLSTALSPFATSGSAPDALGRQPSLIPKIP